jgi:transcriptional regulator with XRE-family HTH domain
MAVFSVMINAAQIRAARAILQLSQQDLADRTDLSRDAIKQAEKDGARVFSSSLQAIQGFFQSQGLSFSSDETSVSIRLGESHHAQRD